MNIQANINPAADWSDTAALQQRLHEAAERIQAMAGDVGLAKHVIEYDSDRRKRALARAMGPGLAGGASAAKADAEARASEPYAKELEVLAKQHAAALQQVQEHDAAKVAWETARSLLAMLREQVKM